MEKERRQLAEARIMSNEKLREIWESGDDVIREFMLLLVTASRQEVNEVKRILLEGKIREDGDQNG